MRVPGVFGIVDTTVAVDFTVCSEGDVFFGEKGNPAACPIAKGEEVTTVGALDELEAA